MTWVWAKALLLLTVAIAVPLSIAAEYGPAGGLAGVVAMLALSALFAALSR